jgi:hypothetical protein
LGEDWDLEQVTIFTQLSLVMARDFAEIEVKAGTAIAGFSGWNHGYPLDGRKKQDGEIILRHQLSLAQLTGRQASDSRDAASQCGLDSPRICGGEGFTPSGRDFSTGGPLAEGEATAHSGLATLIAGHFPNNEQRAGGYQQYPQRLTIHQSFYRKIHCKNDSYDQRELSCDRELGKCI